MVAPIVASKQATVSLNAVSFAYQTKNILNGLTFDAYPGQILAIMGGSGCGKTTALRLIGGQYAPNQGSITMFGEPLNHINKAQLQTIRKKIGMLFQFGALFSDLSVFDNVAFPLRELTKLPETLIGNIVRLKLNAVGLSQDCHLMPNEISGGMSRRVALARALALDPQIMLYDEPFAGLDPITMNSIANLIRNLTDAFQTTAILVSHDVEETFAIADQIIILDQGNILAQGTPTEIRNHSNPVVQHFILGQASQITPNTQQLTTLKHFFGLEND
jgi:phospholipid/cholesterol/gamma-HCH transport system ATP-binding protein